MAYNQYQKAYFKAVFGHDPKTYTNSPTEKVWALYEGDKEVERGNYALLVWKKKQLSKKGLKFLKIKPVLTKAKNHE